MLIRFSRREPVKATPAAAFALIDDLPRTPEWLPNAVALTNTGGGPNKAGDRLRYVYRQGSKEAEMGGVIAVRDPGRRLLCTYSDFLFDVSVDLGVETEAGQTITIHTIEVTPRTLMAKLLSPIVRIGIKRQTIRAAANLRRLIESAPGH